MTAGGLGKSVRVRRASVSCQETGSAEAKAVHAMGAQENSREMKLIIKKKEDGSDIMIEMVGRQSSQRGL